MANEFTRGGGDYQSESINDFLHELYSRPSAAHQEALKLLRESGMPQIHIGPNEGKILSLCMRMIGAGKVVELGTLAGYSALWLLDGMEPEGHLWTFEYEPKHARTAGKVFERANVQSRVTVVEGEALKTLPGIEKDGPFDAVFIDADKVNYLNYAKWAHRNLRPGGLVLADNAYLFGYLAGKAPDERADAARIEAMREFHRFVAANFVAVTIPTGDGLAVGLKE